MTQDTESHSIVVIGAMNPRIHHPTWYRLIGAIDESTEQKALADGSGVCIPPLAQFQTPWFKIECLEDRWSIETGSSSHLQRIREVTETVFDVRLPETPMGSIGFNFNYHLKTDVPDVPSRLGACARLPALGLQTEGFSSAQMSCRLTKGEMIIAVTIAPSVQGAQWIYVGNNYHQPFQRTDPPEHFKLGPIIDKLLLPASKESIEGCDRVVRALGSAGGGVA